MPNLIDETRNKYGKLTVIKQAESASNGSARWWCKCDCGNLVIACGSHLRSGKNDCSQLGPWPAHLYRKYRWNADARNINWDLSFEILKSLINGNCYYCGSKPTYHKSHGGKIYNGIDRVNPNVGYIESNVVTCCSLCNSMKSDLSIKLFIEQCKKVSKYKAAWSSSSSSAS